jgi:chromate reductase, NAD(P)H dehydrogenase (quinone)
LEGRKTIFVIIGSASENSANERLMASVVALTESAFQLTIFSGLKTLPHFDPEQSANQPPASVRAFREAVDRADGVIICTPEYVFSIPSGLKNAIEWCVATTVFSDKPTGFITASAHGQKGQEELQRIMRTLMAKFTDETTLLIQGIRGKVNASGEITDAKTQADLVTFVAAFKSLVTNTSH